MLDSLTSYNAADFRQRYQGTFGLYPTSKGKILVLVRKVDSKRVMFTDAENTEYFANVDAGVSFEFLPVARGWHNGKKGAVMLQRVPARQWQRGISESNTVALLPPEHNKGGLKLVSPSFDTLDCVVNPYPLPYAINEKLTKTRDSVAISKHFCLSGDSLYFFDKIIGSCEGSSIHVTYSPIIQELSDTIRRSSLPFNIV